MSSHPLKTASGSLALAMCLALTGCGGGGSSTPTPAPNPTPSPSPTPAPTPSPAPTPGQFAPAQTYGNLLTFSASSVVDSSSLTAAQYNRQPTADYLQGAAERQVFEMLNAERLHCGFGGLNQQHMLDQASQNHAFYLLYNNLIDSGHDELSQLAPYFTGAGIPERVSKVGYVYSALSEELVTARSQQSLSEFAEYGLRSLMMAPYHMAGLFAGYREVGISVNNSGTVQGRTPALSAMTLTLGRTRTGISSEVQQRPDGQVLTYPCQGVTNTHTALFNESPNPFVGRDLLSQPVGQPVLLQVNDQMVLRVQQVSYREALTQVALPTQTLTSQSGPALIKGHQAIVVPMQALKAHTDYQVHLSGLVVSTAGSKPFETQFTFTTGSSNSF